MHDLKKKSLLKKEIVIDTTSKDIDQSLQKERMKQKIKGKSKIIRRRVFKKEDNLRGIIRKTEKV